MSLILPLLAVEPSPLHDRAAELCRTNAWVRAGRLTLVDVYSAIEEEYWALKADAGLADLSHRITYRFDGAGAGAALERLLTGRVDALAVGQFVDVLWCSDGGYVIGEGTLMRVAEESFLLVTPEPCRGWIEDTIAGMACTLAELTTESAWLGLEGPAAPAVLEAMGFTAAVKLEGGSLLSTSFRGLAVGAARRADGLYELWTSATEARVLWDRLMRAGKPLGLKPVGVAAQTILRLEARHPRQGVEYSSAVRARRWEEVVRPEYLGLAARIDLTKPGFVGQSALSLAMPAPRRLVHLRAPTSDPLGQGVIVGADGKPLGYLTSSAYSPGLETGLALGWIEGPVPKGPLGLALPPDAASRGRLRQIPCTHMVLG